MSDLKKQTGSCLCGSVTFTVAKLSHEAGVCHCGMCQKWAAGPFMTVNAGLDVTFEGTEHISTYDSAGWGTRSFCGKCGSPLYYKLKSGGGHFITASLFDDKEHFALTHQIFIDRKPGYYSFAEETEKLTEAETIAKFSGGS